MRATREATGTLSSEAMRVLALGAADRLTLPEFCERSAVEPAALADPDARVPVATVVRAWDELPALVGDNPMIPEASARSPRAIMVGGRTGRSAQWRYHAAYGSRHPRAG